MNTNYKNLQYFIDFARLVTSSYCNNIDSYNRIKNHILNYGYITVGKLSEYMHIKLDSCLGYNREINANYGWTRFEVVDTYLDVRKRGAIYFDRTINSIRLTLPINLKENIMTTNKEYTKQYAIGKLNEIINTNPDCDAEGTNDTVTVRISDEDYEYSIVRKDKVKYVALKDIVSYVKYIVTPGSTLWEHNRNATFNSVIGLRPYVSMETLAQLFPRESYSFEARSKLYDDITYALSDPCCKTSRKDDNWLVYIGKDSMNNDVLELMRINKNSSFFDGRRVSLSKGETNDNI